MKFMIPFLIAMLTVASVAQSQSAVALGVPSVAIPKTTEVLVIQTPKQGVTHGLPDSRFASVVALNGAVRWLRGVPGVAIAPYRGRTHATASPNSKRVL